MKGDASQMTKDQRLREIAAIFARGVRRYHERRREKFSQLPEKESKGLEVPGETRLSVSRVSC